MRFNRGCPVTSCTCASMIIYGIFLANPCCIVCLCSTSISRNASNNRSTFCFSIISLSNSICCFLSRIPTNKFIRWITINIYCWKIVSITSIISSVCFWKCCSFSSSISIYIMNVVTLLNCAWNSYSKIFSNITDCVIILISNHFIRLIYNTISCITSFLNSYGKIITIILFIYLYREVNLSTIGNFLTGCFNNTTSYISLRCCITTIS